MQKTDRRKRRYMKKTSRSPEIVRLWRSGVTSPTRIARQLGCSVANVAKTIKRHVPEYTPRPKGGLVIDGISETDMAWLRAEAAKANVTIPDMARAMLTDAIADLEMPTPEFR
jgi:hypothetical protein